MAVCGVFFSPESRGKNGFGKAPAGKSSASRPGPEAASRQVFRAKMLLLKPEQ
jgi:hypothetical protein